MANTTKKVAPIATEKKSVISKKATEAKAEVTDKGVTVSLESANPFRSEETESVKAKPKKRASKKADAEKIAKTEETVVDTSASPVCVDVKAEPKAEEKPKAEPKKRASKAKAKAKAKAEPMPVVKRIALKINEELMGINLFFTSKADSTTEDRVFMKSIKMRWNPREGYWWCKLKSDDKLGEIINHFGDRLDYPDAIDEIVSKLLDNHEDIKRAETHKKRDTAKGKAKAIPEDGDCGMPANSMSMFDILTDEDIDNLVEVF